MGLDQYIYKTRKLGEEEKNKIKQLSYDSLYGEYAVFLLDDESKSLLDGLIPYGVLLDVETPFLDLRSIKLDFGIPEAACVTGESFEAGSHKILFRWCGKGGETKTKKAVLCKEDEKKKYTVYKKTRSLIIQLEESGYWRKDYELQDFMHEELPQMVENCGYYKIPEDVMEKLLNMESFMDGFSSDGFLEEDEAFFYHEWY